MATKKTGDSGESKCRYWTAILYPENMVENWQNKIDLILQLPYAYCIHDKDLLLEDSEEERKPHVHLMVVWGNNTTYNSALKLFKKLGEKSCNTCERITGVRMMYDYLIHDTKKCREQGKHLYEKVERIEGNNFDIGEYEQLSLKEKDEIELAIYDIIMENEFTNFMDLCIYIRANCDNTYFKTLKTNSGFYERVTRGMYQKLSGVLRNE